MAWRLARSLERLRDQINAKAPNRSKASDGTIGDAAHQAEGTGSDHNPNAAGVVCAMDITHDPGGGLDAGQLAQSLVDSRDARIKYIIFNGRTVDVRWGWYWQAYNGSNPHTKHVHVSVWNNYDDTRDWSVGGSSSPAPAPSKPPTSAVQSGRATVTVDVLNVRAQPTSKSALAGSRQLTKGQWFEYSALVPGENVNGVSTWIRSTKGNYVWAGGTNLVTATLSSSSGGRATVTGVANVRSAPNTTAPLSGSRRLQPGQWFDYVAKVQGQNVSGNNIWYKSTKGNFVWSGNVTG